MEIERRWFKVREIAEYLGLNEKTVYRLSRRHPRLCSKTPGVGVRFDKVAVDKLLETGELSVRRGRPRKCAATYL